MRALLLITALISVLLISCEKDTNETLLYVGTYTDAGSEGIYCYQFDERTGDLSLKSITENKENPSFLAISPDKKYLFAVSEVKESPGIDSGSVTSYRISASGELNKINQKPTKGYHPCHVAVSPDGRFVVASNYSSGSLSLFEVNDDGGLTDCFQQIQHTGSGPDSARQKAPHAHSAQFSFSGEVLVSADLGTDKVEFYRFNQAANKFEEAEQAFLNMTPGAGPRHFDFSPDGKFIYVMNEMHSTVSVLEKTGDTFDLIQTLSSLPTDFVGSNSGADIHVSSDGRFVYSSNRGHNSIAVFERDDKGRLTLVETEPVVGDWPRNFTISPDGNYLLVANKKSNNITLFDIDAELGMLTYTGKSLEVPRPVCLEFLVR
ncbi:lactonase family protein [Sunxiuqinia indica]|uniref:lactonase family protein n=1 Tax=Sunxiuqinia indica TaxID=2692584 RepID=UPI00135C4F7A|nr:lactonase family protein [Sunxiuqinia indica]